jgi:hypothetical protein
MGSDDFGGPVLNRQVSGADRDSLRRNERVQPYRDGLLVLSSEGFKRW